MTKKERILAAMQGRHVDCIPAGFYLHFPEKSFFGKEAVEAHLNFYKQTDTDFLKVMNENLYRTVSPLTGADDWKHVRPLTGKEPWIRNQVDIIKELADRVGDEVFILATIHGVFASAFHATGLPDSAFARRNPVCEHLCQKPELVGRALGIIAEGLSCFAQACLDAGADGIYYAALGAESYRFDRKTFESYIKPHDLTVLHSFVSSMCTVLHMCKDRLHIDLYQDYPGEIVNWAIHEQNIGLSEGRELFRRTILGGFDDRSGILVDGSPADIKSEARRIIETAGTRSFILGADCTLPTTISYEKIRMAVEAAHSYPGQ